MKYPVFTQIIRGAVKREGMTDKEFSKTIGLPPSTLQYRYRNPGTWRLEEIGSVLRHVRFMDDEMKEMKEAIR